MKDNFPHDIEYRYSKRLLKIVKAMDKKLKSLIKQKKNDDSVQDTEKEFKDYMKEYLTDEICLEIATEFTLETVEYSIKNVNREIKEIVGVSFKEQPFYDEKVIEELLKEQAKLIKASPKKYYRSYDKEVSRLVKEAAEEGISRKTLGKAISKATGLEINRANLIARDQIGKLFGKATKMQHEGIGLKTFEWITAGDNRVRSEHKDRSGQIYEWENPPNGEIPGVPICCRCSASVVKSEVLSL